MYLWVDDQLRDRMLRDWQPNRDCPLCHDRMMVDERLVRWRPDECCPVCRSVHAVVWDAQRRVGVCGFCNVRLYRAPDGSTWAPMLTY
jgi:hypothetical protein